MTSSPAQLRSLYRAFLRELPPQPILSSPRSYFQQKLRDSFLQPQGSKPTISLSQAEQYVQYLRAQRKYIMLVERYNPGMGMTEEERVRLTARRVGLDVPIEYEKTQ